MSSTQRVASAYLAKQAAAPQLLASGVKQQANAELKKRGLAGVALFRTPSQVISLIVSILQKYNLSAPLLTPILMGRDNGALRLAMEIITDTDPLNPAKVQNSLLSVQYAKNATGQFTATVQLT